MGRFYRGKSTLLVPRRQCHHGRNPMRLRNSVTTIALATALLAGAGARADDAAKLPNLKGQWVGVGAAPDASWDPSKPAGAGQEAPLTPEYRGIHQAILASRAGGAKEPTT